MHPQYLLLLCTVGLAGVTGVSALGNSLDNNIAARSDAASPGRSAPPLLSSTAQAGLVTGALSIVDEIVEAGRAGKRLVKVGETEVELANMRLRVRTPSDVAPNEVQHVLITAVPRVGSMDIPNTPDNVAALAFHFDPTFAASEVTFESSLNRQTMRLRKVHGDRETVHAFTRTNRQDAFRGYWSETKLVENVTQGESSTTKIFEDPRAPRPWRRGYGSHEGPLRKDQVQTLRDLATGEVQKTALSLTEWGDHVFTGPNAALLDDVLRSRGHHKLERIHWNGEGRFVIEHADDRLDPWEAKFRTEVAPDGAVKTESKLIRRSGSADRIQLTTDRKGQLQLTITRIRDNLSDYDRVRTENFADGMTFDRAVEFMAKFKQADEMEFVKSPDGSWPRFEVVRIAGDFGEEEIRNALVR